ncbi:hypothetical protein [Micromonospora sp. NPDC005652]|uniref:hypothetical protein n=1 Tax=Micromonospora sp. NPDC005652 TaxID=3157046 RepID=UPI0033C617D9
MGDNKGARLIATVGEGGTTGIGPSGRGVQVPAGEYTVAELDGVGKDMVFLDDPEQPGTLLAQVETSEVNLRREES